MRGNARWLTALAMLFAACAALPVLAIVTRGLAPGTGATWIHLANTVLPGYVANTLALVVLVALGAAVGGTVSGWLIARRRFPGADRPGFALGLVAFELRGDFAEAASRFDRYLAEHPRGALADEAAGRLLESWHRLGRRNEARRAAAAYLARGTAGPYTAIARELAAQ